ncbi:MAG TPA: hypothetical protein VGV12_13140 [Gemmatimonadales bacterium]|nr:hypothetical protein [Gemmatimonadales bacterium]
MTDDELEQLAQRLGARAAERLDVEATARAVVERLRAERTRGERIGISVPRQWLRIAAALVIAVGGGALALRITGRFHPRSAPVTAAGADLDGLSADQLHRVLDAVDQPAGDIMVSAQDVSLDDLNTVELRALLESLEG